MGLCPGLLVEVVVDKGLPAAYKPTSLTPSCVDLEPSKLGGDSMVLLRVSVVILGLILGTLEFVSAEAPAPSVHWGAIDYPDQERTLTAGLTLNRFTEFDTRQQRYNNIRQTMGFNFATVSWTERWSRLQGWGTNLTLGIGPTGEQPTRWLQNEVVHTLRGLDRVPVRDSRSETDFMVGGSLTRWFTVLGPHETLFAGVGFGTGSLYHEVYARLGLRRLSLADAVQSLSGADPALLRTVSDFVRFSALARYSRPYTGAAFREVAPQTYLGQWSLSFGDYRKAHVPSYEFEIALSIDSGLFVDFKGDSLEERYWSLAFRFPYVMLETWNERINTKDMGPTYGITMVFDVLRFHALLSN